MKVTIDGIEYVPATFKSDKPLPVRKLFAAARRRLKLTLQRVADDTGLSLSTVFGAENNTTTSTIVAMKLCRYYSIDLDTYADAVLAHVKLMPAAPRKATA